MSYNISKGQIERMKPALETLRSNISIAQIPLACPSGWDLGDFSWNLRSALKAVEMLEPDGPYGALVGAYRFRKDTYQGVIFAERKHGGVSGTLGKTNRVKRERIYKDYDWSAVSNVLRELQNNLPPDAMTMTFKEVEPNEEEMLLLYEWCQGQEEEWLLMDVRQTGGTGIYLTCGLDDERIGRVLRSTAWRPDAR